MVRETSDRSELPLSLVRANENRSLVERCIASDRAAQRELFRRESRRVHATLFRILGGNLSMDDLIQDVFIEVFKSLPSFRGEASLSTWIDRCTVHIAISYLRKKRPKLVEMVVETQSGGSSPEEHMLLKEAARRLYAELDRSGPDAPPGDHASRHRRPPGRRGGGDHGSVGRCHEDARVARAPASREVRAARSRARGVPVACPGQLGQFGGGRMRVQTMVPLPPEVEPLGDVRWARIEQSLMQRLEEIPAAETKPADVRAKSRSRVWPVTLVATFAVSAAAAVTLHVARPSIHASTSRVVTEASPSHVTIAENSIDVSPESGIVVTEEEHATVLTLERGEVSLHVAPREKDRPFLVEAGDVHVRVVGTEFTVRRVGIGATVAVRHGVVEVREHGELALVKGGERWPADAKDVAPAANAGATDSVGSGGGATGGALDAPIAPRSPHPPGPPPRRQGVGNVNRSASVDESSSPALPAGRGPGGSVVIAEHVPALQPPPSAVPLPRARPPHRRRPPLRAERPIPIRSRRPPRAEPPARALRLYTDLARGSDAWAQNALYAAGRLQADCGARGDADRLLEEYLRRFPRGSNAQMRVRCASLSGRRPPRRAYALATRVLATFALALGLLAASARPARAAARRIVLMHADADLTRSVDFALYPWDIAVVEVDEPLPDATAPDAVASARSIAKRHSADAIAWIQRTDESATLWFFDASDSSLHSHPLPLSRQDAAQLAAVALTLKTLVRATPWESRIPTVVHEHKGTGWESHLELDVLARVPVSGPTASHDSGSG